MNQGLVTSDIKLRAPVAIAVGAGFKREIGSVAEMQNFLAEWPPGRRGSGYGAALRACEAARAGRTEADAARQAFVGFAEKVGIAWTGADPVTVLREARTRRVRARREARISESPLKSPSR